MQKLSYCRDLKTTIKKKYHTVLTTTCMKNGLKRMIELCDSSLRTHLWQ